MKLQSGVDLRGLPRILGIVGAYRCGQAEQCAPDSVRLSMKRYSLIAGGLAGLLLAACEGAVESKPQAQSLGAAVTNLFERAQAGDINYFTALVVSPAPGSAAGLMAMVRRSGMLTNYTERLHSTSPTEARLDYHYLEKGCHFQVNLAKQGSAWQVTGIWPCR